MSESKTLWEIPNGYEDSLRGYLKTYRSLNWEYLREVVQRLGGWGFQGDSVMTEYWQDHAEPYHPGDCYPCAEFCQEEHCVTGCVSPDITKIEISGTWTAFGYQALKNRLLGTKRDLLNALRNAAPPSDVSGVPLRMSVRFTDSGTIVFSTE